MTRAIPLFTVALVIAQIIFAGCADYPKNPPPGTCAPQDLICYSEPISGRELALRCNDGEVQGAIWLVDDVCVDGETCDAGVCVPP